ncbi:MAG: adenylate/guanylate cyclase domain-containing protein [Pseudomonadota bacterium]
MTTTAPERARTPQANGTTPLWRGHLAQRARLISGLILFAYVLTHFLNHAVGLIGVETMEVVRDWRVAVTRSLIGTIVLAAALGVHMVLALTRTLARTTVAMPLWEVAQVISGLAIPLLLAKHIIATRISATLFTTNDTYEYELAQLWPGLALEQSILLILVWLHAMIGLHFWLRLSRWYQRAQPIVIAAGVAIPILALTGFMSAGREVARRLAEDGAFSAMQARTNWPDDGEIASLLSMMGQANTAFYVVIGALATVVILRALPNPFGGKAVGITYVAGPTVRARPGPTLLEISRAHGVPHTAICGGRGRCTTCRVVVLEGAEALAPPSPTEARALSSIRAAPNVRLACQVYPPADLSVERLVEPGARRSSGRARLSFAGPDDAARGMTSTGTERTLAVLFFDIRGFTKISETKLPYDVVHILNTVFRHAGAAVEHEGGRIDKFMGDGMMALFGIEVEPAQACRQALAAAAAIDRELERVNTTLASDLDQPLRIGIGVHVGPLVLGRIGHGGSANITVIGDVVNTASRLEAMTKEMSVQAVVSEDVFITAGMALPPAAQEDAAMEDTAQAAASQTQADASKPRVALTRAQVTIRGRAAPLAVIQAKAARALTSTHAPGTPPDTAR